MVKYGRGLGLESTNYGILPGMFLSSEVVEWCVMNLMMHKFSIMAGTVMMYNDA